MNNDRCEHLSEVSTLRVSARKSRNTKEVIYTFFSGPDVVFECFTYKKALAFSKGVRYALDQKVIQGLGPNQKKYVEMLRSDKYCKIRGDLRNCDDTIHYSALGLMGELASQNGMPFLTDSLRSLSHSATLWLGLEDRSGDLHETVYFKGTRFTNLEELNDSDITFQELADLIERYPWKFFICRK